MAQTVFKMVHFTFPQALHMAANFKTVINYQGIAHIVGTYSYHTIINVASYFTSFLRTQFIVKHVLCAFNMSHEIFKVSQRNHV
jgi:hypothetical protein